MKISRGEGFLCFVTLFLFLCSTNALLSPKGINFEVQAFMSIKASLMDPHGILENWMVMLLIHVVGIWLLVLLRILLLVWEFLVRIYLVHYHQVLEG